jgi:hypothetical protein
MKAYQEKHEEISEETQSQLEHQEVPKEEAAVKTVTALKKQYGNRWLAMGGNGKPKKRTQGNGGARKEVAAAYRGMTPLCHPCTAQGTRSSGTRL